MEEFFNKYATLIGIIGFLMGAITFVDWIFKLFKRKKNKKGLSYSSITIPVIHSKLITVEKKEVFFDGVHISKRLSVSKLVLFNSGDTPILKSEIAENSPLLLEFPLELTVYKVEVFFNSNPASNVTITKLEPQKYLIKLDYLNKDDGFLIYIYHSEWRFFKFVLQGNIIGLNKFDHIENWQYHNNLKPVEGIGYPKWSIPVSSMALIYISIDIFFANGQNQLIDSPAGRLKPFAFYMVILWWIISLWIGIPRKRLPKILKKKYLNKLVPEVLEQITIKPGTENL